MKTEYKPEEITDVVLRLFRCTRYNRDGESNPVEIDNPPWPWEDSGFHSDDYELEYEVLPEFINIMSEDSIDLFAFPRILEMIEPFRAKYYKFTLELAGGYGDDSGWSPFVPHVIGYRKETEMEFNERVRRLQDRADKARKTKEENKKKKEEKRKQKEIALMLELQAKYTKLDTSNAVKMRESSDGEVL